MAAARSGPADARIPCPLCGGLIHPIAGRCKHCKGDLSALRSSRPSAIAALPALHQASPPHVNGHANGHAAPQHLVQAVAAAAPNGRHASGPVAVAIDAAQPILPPRPTGRYPTAPVVRSTWKSWPVIVIIIAVIAIIAAVVLMLWPPDRGDDGVTGAAPTAGPERMNTNPMPAVPAPAPRAVDPDVADPGDPADPDDPLGTPHGGRGGSNSGAMPTMPMPPDDIDIDSLDPQPQGNGGMPAQTRMMGSIALQACKRMVSCGVTDPAAQAICRQVARSWRSSPPTCAAATRCLKAIDDLDCDLLNSNPLDVMQSQAGLADCVDAMSC